MLKLAFICPHPPIIIPGIGSEDDLFKVEKTIEGMNELAKLLRREKIDTLLLISPHAPMRKDIFLINYLAKLRGDLGNFGWEEDFEYDNDSELINTIEKEVEKSDLKIGGIDFPLDHGVLVPLFYLTQQIKVNLVVLSFSWLDFKKHYNYGKILGKVIKQSSKKIGVVASGDLSHRINYDAPAGYDKNGAIFDKKLRDLLEKGDIQAILNLDQQLVESAGECGLRSILILLGILNDKRAIFQQLSYECPFGVGYLVGKFNF